MFAPKPSGRRPELCLSEHNSAEIMYILPGKVNGLATNLSAIPCHTNCETYVKGSVNAEHGNVSELPEARASLPRVYCRRVCTGSETAPGQVVRYSSVELVYTLLMLSGVFPELDRLTSVPLEAAQISTALHPLSVSRYSSW